MEPLIAENGRVERVLVSSVGEVEQSILHGATPPGPRQV